MHHGNPSSGAIPVCRDQPAAVVLVRRLCDADGFTPQSAAATRSPAPKIGKRTCHCKLRGQLTCPGTVGGARWLAAASQRRVLVGCCVKAWEPSATDSSSSRSRSVAGDHGNPGGGFSPGDRRLVAVVPNPTVGRPDPDTVRAGRCHRSHGQRLRGGGDGGQCQREILGMDVGASEDGDFWLAFLQLAPLGATRGRAGTLRLI